MRTNIQNVIDPGGGGRVSEDVLLEIFYSILLGSDVASIFLGFGFFLQGFIFTGGGEVLCIKVLYKVPI